jgi:putative Ca2+/H+ antiporter (TMEM165/GDT1 family)
MAAFLISMALVFAAEFGDKTQLVALAFATRYRATIVLAGITVAALLAHLFSTAVGQVAGNLIPQTTINVIAGLAFIGFGVWTMRGESDESEEELKEHKWGPFISVALTFFLAELGDKTMLATVTIASQQRDFVGVWLGSSIGMVMAGAIAIWLGTVLGKRVPETVVKACGAIIFIATGVVTLAHAAMAMAH